MRTREEIFFERLKTCIEDYYEAVDEPDKTDIAKRYCVRLYGKINAMCETYEILTGTRLVWGRDGYRIDTDY